MVFYNVFVAFVGLNNNTILAKQNIEFGSVSSNRYPDPAENASIEATPILNIGLLAHAFKVLSAIPGGTIGFSQRGKCLSGPILKLHKLSDSTQEENVLSMNWFLVNVDK